MKDKSIFQNVVRGIQMHPPINIIQKFSLSANFVYIYIHDTVQLTRVQDSSFDANYTQLVVQIWMSYLQRFILPYCAHLFLVVSSPLSVVIISKTLPTLIESKYIFYFLEINFIAMILYNFFSYVKYIEQKRFGKLVKFDVKKYLIVIRINSNINFKSYGD